jgi:hypothetical protein
MDVDNSDRHIGIHWGVAFHHERAGDLIFIEELKCFLG